MKTCLEIEFSAEVKRSFLEVDPIWHGRREKPYLSGEKERIGVFGSLFQNPVEHSASFEIACRPAPVRTFFAPTQRRLSLGVLEDLASENRCCKHFSTRSHTANCPPHRETR